MKIAAFLYLLALLSIGIRDALHTPTLDEFVVAGRRQGTGAVFFSLLATILGASATMGVAARAEAIGFPAFWWLGFGAIGLAAQGFFLARPLRAFGARTLPELAGLAVGPVARRLVAAVIAVSWIGIVAAQFAGAAELLRLALGVTSETGAVLATAATVTLYTLAGGQLSVVRTDALQLGVLALGFLGLFLWIFGGCAGGESVPLSQMRLFSASFGVREAVPLFFAVGGAYFLGPDIASRALLARDGATARRASLAAAPVLLAFGIAITLTGMWASANLPGSGNPLFRLAQTSLPKPLAALLFFGLLSALVSSADTCLVNAAAIASHDLIGVRHVGAVRIAVALIGAGAALLALRGQDIIALLVSAYSVYTPGVVLPLAVAILTHRRRTVRTGLWLASVAVGGALGCVPTVLGLLHVSAPPFVGWFPVAGMAVSFALALAASY